MTHHIRSYFGVASNVAFALKRGPSVPASLPPLPRSCKASHTMCFWHAWDSHPHPGGSGETPLRHLLSGTLFRVEQIPQATLPLASIDALETSTSPLELCVNLDQFTDRYCQHLDINTIGHMSPDEAVSTLLLCNSPYAVPSAARDDHFLTFGWDARLFLINCDGSHRIALARSLALRNHLTTTITLPMTRVTLDKERVAQLATHYYMRLVRIDTDPAAFAALRRSINDCHINLHQVFLPVPYHNYVLWLFSNRADKSRIIADLLHNAGSEDFANTLMSLAT